MQLRSVFAAAIFVLGSSTSVVSFAADAPAAKPGIYDDFEGPTLSNQWMTLALAPGSYAIQSEITRAGRGALRITLHQGDVFVHGEGGDADNERDELLEAAPRNITRIDVPYEASWSMYLPKDFPIVSERLVVAQWWEYCAASTLPCHNNSPVLAVRYIGGKLLITQDIDHQYRVLYEEKRDLREHWLDLRFQVRFSQKDTGIVRVWLDGKQVVDYAGMTSNTQSVETGYISPVFLLFHMGLYRNVMPQPMTIYLDEYRRRVLSDDELPPPKSAP